MNSSEIEYFLSQRQYRKFVRGGIHQGTPWSGVQGQVLLGEKGFVEKFRDLLEDRRGVKEIPRLHSSTEVYKQAESGQDIQWTGGEGTKRYGH